MKNNIVDSHTETMNIKWRV